MTTYRAIAALIAVGLPLLAAHAQAAELKLFLSTAFKSTVEEIRPQAEQATESKLALTIGPAAVLKDRIEKGEPFDAALLTTAALESLAKQGKIAAGTETAIARAGLGVAVHKSAPKPDISTTEAFKRTLLNAKSIGLSARGASGSYFKALFEKLGITEALKPKLRLLDGAPGEAVAKGEVEIGMTQISEILPYADIQLVGPLPVDIQMYTHFAAGVSATTSQGTAAKALIKFLTSPAAAAVIKARGLIRADRTGRLRSRNQPLS